MRPFVRAAGRSRTSLAREPRNVRVLHAILTRDTTHGNSGGKTAAWLLFSEPFCGVNAARAISKSRRPLPISGPTNRACANAEAAEDSLISGRKLRISAAAPETNG